MIVVAWLGIAWFVSFILALIFNDQKKDSVNVIVGLAQIGLVVLMAGRILGWW